MQEQHVIVRDVLPEPLETPQVLSKFAIIKNMLDAQFLDTATEHLGKGFYKIDFPEKLCTGADVTEYFSIPFLHKLHRIEFKHTDGSYADSVAALTYELKYGSTHRKSLLFSIISETGSTVTDKAHLFSDFWRSTSRYQMVSNTTNGHFLFMSMLIEIQDDPATGE